MKTFSVPLRPALYALWLLSYVLYPFWYAGPTLPAKLGILALFLVLPALLLRYAGFLRETPVTVTLPFPDKQLLVSLLPALLVVTLAHLPFWAMPLPLGGDDQYHAGPPAYFLHKLNLFFPVSFLRAGAALLAGAVFFARKRIGSAFSRVPALKYAAAAAAFAALAGYVYALVHYRIIDNAGELTTLVVYAPLSRLLYLAGYFLFGIHELVPYAIQYGFIIMAGYFMLKTALLLERRLNAAVFMLVFLLFPTLFYFSNTALLACGVLFFYSATFYWFLKYLLTDEEHCMAYSMLFMTVGMLYKNELLAGWISIAACSAFLLLIGKWRFSRWFNSVRYAAIPVLFFLPYIFSTPIWGVSNQPLLPDNLLHSQTLFINALNAYRTLGLPLTLVMLSAAAWTLVRYRASIVVWFLLGFAALHYVMITATIANTYIRHSQPFYLPFIFFTAFAVARAVEAAERRAVRWALTAAAALLLAYPISVQKNPLQRTNLSNLHEALFPYPEMLKQLASRAEGTVVYAPCLSQPSHFYAAKYDLPKKIVWAIKPGVETLDETDPSVLPEVIHERCARLNAEYFFFPEYDIFQRTGLKKTLSGLPGLFVLEQELDHRGNKAYLFKVVYQAAPGGGARR